MKTRVAKKIFRNCIYGCYTKKQTKQAYRIWKKQWPKEVQYYFDDAFISGGCHDTFRWRGCEACGWTLPILDYDVAKAYGEWVI